MERKAQAGQFLGLFIQEIDSTCVFLNGMNSEAGPTALPEGGIYAFFEFLWSMGSTELAFLSAELILTPFDFSPKGVMSAMSSPGSFVDSMHFYLGVTIR